jgi:hypothetical protein
MRVIGVAPHAGWHPEWCEPSECKPGLHRAAPAWERTRLTIDDGLIRLRRNQFQDTDDTVASDHIELQVKNTAFADVECTLQLSLTDARDLIGGLSALVNEIVARRMANHR